MRQLATMRATVGIMLGLILGPIGCASYTAKPLDVGAIALQQKSNSIDPNIVRETLARAVPGYSWDGREWDAVTLAVAALITNPELGAARAKIAAAKAEAGAARVAPGPTLTLTAEYAFNPSEASPWLGAAAGDFLLDVGGRRRGKIDAAAIALRSAQYDFLALVWKIRTDTVRAFHRYDLSTKESAIADELVNARDRQLASAANAVNVGALSRMELDRARADAAKDRQLKSAAEAALAAARIDLSTALGVSPESIEAMRLAPVAPGDIKEAAAIADEQIASALQNRTEILKAAAAYDQAESSLRTAVASQFPEIRLGPGYTWERGLSKIPFALSLTFPANDLNSAAIKAAKERREVAGRELEAAVASVAASIARADADYRAAWAALALLREKSVPSAEALARQADRQLSEGLIDRVEWSASQAGLSSAKLDEIAALRRGFESETALEEALRRPLSGPDLMIGDAAIQELKSNRP